MTFHQYSKKIVTEYLGTVAYVDDLIFSERKEHAPEINTEIVPATRISVAETVKEKAKPESSKPEQQLIPNIDPKIFTNAFLKKGIQCSLFEIANDNDPLDDLVNILYKSDVVILDWQMHQDNGRKAKELLKSVLSKSKKPELRLFIIYTDANNFASLLKEEIIPELNKINITGDPDESGCIYKFGHSKIIVFKKENGKMSENSTSDEELPDKIIDEFIEITKGLVSNTALRAVSVIRRNSHNLLAKFNKDLDAAYFNHRAFLETPTDSELHLISWLSDEIKDMLFVNRVSNETQIDKIRLVIDECVQPEFGIYDKNGNENKKISKDEMINLLNKGCINYNKENEKNGRNVPQSWFKHFYKSFQAHDDLINEKFAALSSLSSSSFSHDNHQLLSLGTLIQNNDEFLICIQPSCDSLRLKQNTKFVFLRAKKDGDNLDIVIPNNSNFIKLSIEYKSENIELITFSPENGTVVSKTIAAHEIFEDINKNQYSWLGNLKYPFAQRISTNFAFELSRVGLDESEWLRRS